MELKLCSRVSLIWCTIISGSHICSFTFMISYVFLVSQTYLFLPMPIKVLSHKYFIFGNHILLHIYDHMFSLFATDTDFSHLWQELMKLYTCVSMHNLNAYEVVSDNLKYFTFGLHFFSCMTTPFENCTHTYMYTMLMPPVIFFI